MQASSQLENLSNLSRNPLLAFDSSERDTINKKYHGKIKGPENIPNLDQADKVKLAQNIEKFILNHYTFIDQAENKKLVIADLKNLKDAVVSLNLPEESSKLNEKLGRILDRLSLVPGPINQMPRDVLFYTFLKAVQDVNDIKNLRLVCKRFKGLVEDPQVVRSLCDRAGEFNIPNSHVLWMIKNFGGNDLSINLFLTSKDLKPLMELAPRIKSLDGMAPLTQETPEGVEVNKQTIELIKKCTELKEFKLYFPTYFSMANVAELIESLPPKLQTIRIPNHSLSEPGVPTTQSVISLLHKHLPNLTSIHELTFDYDLSQEEKVALLVSLLKKEDGLPRYPNLEELTFGHVEMTPQVYQVMHTYCPHLNPFPVRGTRSKDDGVEDLSDEEFIEIIKKIPAISHLHIEHGYNLREETFDKILEICKDLKSITLSGWTDNELSKSKVDELESKGIKITRNELIG